MMPSVDFDPDKFILPDVWYGVWLTGRGWWKLNDKDKEHIFATLNWDMARQQAKWVGGVVLIIDDALKDFEEQMLAAERVRAQRKKAWHI